MKKLSALSLSTATFFSLVPSAFAATGPINVNPCPTDAQGGFNILCTVGASGVGGLITAIITILFIVATLLAVGFLIYGGIKWITSGGDKAKVEAARGTIVAALVGLVLVFLSYFILNLVAQFFGLDLFNGALVIPSLFVPSS